MRKGATNEDENRRSDTQTRKSLSRAKDRSGSVGQLEVEVRRPSETSIEMTKWRIVVYMKKRILAVRVDELDLSVSWWMDSILVSDHWRNELGSVSRTMLFSTRARLPSGKEIILSLMVLSSSVANIVLASERRCMKSSDVNKTSFWQVDCERATCSNDTDPDQVAESRWKRFRDSNCFCDSLCEVYSDCCQDKEQHPANTDHVLPRDSYQCLIVDGLYSTGLPIYVVKSCPSNWIDEVIKENCEKEADTGSGIFLNWFVSDARFILFRNYYCALCHGRTQVTYWRIRIACDDIVRLDADLLRDHRDGEHDVSNLYFSYFVDKLKSGICHLKYEPPNSVDRGRFVRLCKPMIDKCPTNWTENCVREMCEGENSEASFVYSKSKLATYRNMYCALCNQVDNVTCDDVVISSLFRPMVGLMRDTTFYPLNIIFDLNPGGRPIAEYRIGTESGMLLNRTVTKLATCPEQHVYDPFIATCRRVICRSGYVFRNGICAAELTPSNFTADTCALVALNESEYVLFENGSILLNISRILYDREEYVVTVDGLVAVCSNFTRNFTQRGGNGALMKFSEAQGIVSVTGQLISIVALTLTIVVYSWQPKIRNLAGKCVISLSVSLLTAQLLFLIGVSFHVFDSPSTAGACLFFAIATHTAFLCSFAWMNVMAFDICRIFSGSVHKASAEGQKRRFYKYSGYAWISPILIVAVATTVDFRSAPDCVFRPGYAHGLCWITNRKALFLFFALPVALILIANLIMFVLTAVHIYKVQKDTRRATGNTDRRRYGVYIKISIIMGLTWIFAFIATATDSEVLWYFFLIFNTLQGAFIFVAFIFTKQVMGMIRDEYRKLESSVRRPSYKSTEDGTMTTMMSESVSSSNNVRRS
ncbi:hypothetical protein LSH36_34g08015 [Paralvinella palmiformis]|uniref:G-protein coupled receptors family 2 profile 2 domain-containing protein n=1 Tax=Paralvinella palmiformis TaxID=53620 RepID=A0AAD9K8Z6_9ANNE|nr:hypothetical protein LSH36_34g08015 [Paralvinella palmiformis]